MRTSPWLACLLFAAATLARAEEPPGMKEDFAWFATLGYPDNKEFKFVRYTSHWYRILDHQPQPWYRNGWLLAEEARGFTIRTPDVRTVPLERAPANGGDKLVYEPADFPSYAEFEVPPPERRDIGDLPLTGPRLARRPHLFLIAWQCAKRGLDDFAAQLYLTASRERLFENDPRDPREKSFPGESLRARVERDFARYEMWRLVDDFADLNFTRAQLLARATEFPKRFPKSVHGEFAKSLAETLRTMVEEEKAHPALTAEHLGKLPREEQIRELIWRLRDENLRQFNQPGRIEFFERFQENAKGSAMFQLAAIGEPALPALIAALPDQRLTRSIGFRHSDEFSHYPVTVGDAALVTLEKIAQRVFYEKKNETGALMMADGQTENVRAAVDLWWKERQLQGVAGELAAATVKGDKNGALAGQRC